MKNLTLTLIILLFTVFLKAQSVDDRVKNLNDNNKIAKKISPDPETNLNRYITADVAQWQLKNKKIKIYFQIHYVNNQGNLISQFERRQIFTVTNVNYVDSVGVNIPKTDTTTTKHGEYDFLFQNVAKEKISIVDLIKNKIKELDEDGRFN